MAEAPPIRDAAVAELIRAALAEDIGEGDITSAATVSPDRTCIARIKAKAPGVVAGVKVAEAVFLAVDPGVDYQADCADGSHLSPGDHVAVIGGRARSLLAAERVALNFLQHLSGVATATAEAVRMVTGTGVRILDTRKTTPGLRALEKYAVSVGGGVNHRQGLFDRYLIKENHVALAGGVAAAVSAARATRPGDAIEVEVRNTAELEQALEAAADRILLDNFSPAEAAAAVKLVDGRAEVEISGGIRPANLHAYAAAHPDFISLGWLTHSAPALDMSMTLVV
ncbi:MAG: carboxylating nicotinate-nucleotide diphosphorylase [Candidatus Dormibacteraeota bacterium]|nr:carboxylating nicotinate-nucleotide diphosphorylase [Candidatus Dormibacteraeota bacterium]